MRGGRSRRCSPTISSRDSRMVLPTSFVIISAISSARSMQMANAARHSSTRSRSDTLRQVVNASAAARTAAPTWVGEEAVTVPRSSSVAGLLTSISSPSPGTHFPRCRRPVESLPPCHSFSVVRGSFARQRGVVELALRECYRRASRCGVSVRSGV